MHIAIVVVTITVMVLLIIYKKQKGMKKEIDSKSFTAFDFETAKDRMACQIGVVVIKNDIIIERLEYLIQPPGNKYENHNIRVHNISSRETKDVPTFDVIWSKISHLFDGQTIVAHNIDFDLDTLKQNLKYYNLPIPKVKQAICTYRITGLKLNDACEVLGINLTNHHNALSDAEACAKILLYPDKEREEVLKHCRKNVDTSKQAHKYKRTSDLKGINIPEENFMKDKAFVLSGMEESKKEEYREIIITSGGRVTATVSKKTNYLIAGIGVGWRKKEQVEELQKQGNDIKILPEEVFINKIKVYSN